MNQTRRDALKTTGALATLVSLGIITQSQAHAALDRASFEGKTLAEARPQQIDSQREENRRQAVADLSATIEEELDSGTGLTDVAKTLKVELTSSPALTADGRVYGSGEPAPQVLAPVLQTAFQMEESEPQLAQVEAEQFVIFEVARVEEARAALRRLALQRR